ncbi:unnamed protein product, partial [Iphiclides podalirius]
MKKEGQDMAKACCVDGCIAKDVIYFRFPNSRTRCKKWVEAIKLSSRPSHNSLLCSAHFSPQDYSLVRGKVRLKPKVVPSLVQTEAPKPNETKNSHTGPGLDKTDEAEGRTQETEIEINGIEKVDETEKNEETTLNRKYANSKKNAKSATRYVKSRGIGRSRKTGRREQNLTRGRKRKTSDSVTIRPCAEEEKGDIEELLTYYHIKQNKDVAERQNAELLRERERQTSQDGDSGSGAVDIVPSATETEAEPVFIEVSANQDKHRRGSGSPRDCLMLLESVQVELDPNDLLPPEGEEPEGPKEIIVLDDRVEEPISLLTSSDEDDVIVQEPHIDTVLISDESDEDDKPLAGLAGLAGRSARASPPRALLVWRVCRACGFSAASEAQLARHRRAHGRGAKRRHSLPCRLRGHEPA